ncbi:MAG: hypothetical protein SPG09_12805 [Lachnospiraceae bacterium]|nr:hypothetical protein [Clostridium sp.]MDD7176611.1 hypothetical protein [bacterium]MDY5518469.1 hypothetical protein [Lachnospiraceae bacterium]
MRLTLDEAIAHAKEVAEEKYNEGFLCHANPDDGKLDGCVKCAREHEQLAEWIYKFKKQYPGYDVIVYKNDGSRASGQMKLATVRDTYLT